MFGYDFLFVVEEIKYLCLSWLLGEVAVLKEAVALFLADFVEDIADSTLV